MRGETTSKAAVIGRNGADNEEAWRLLPGPASPVARALRPDI